MPKALKYICSTLPKPKLEKLCDKMQMCNWERELCLELYAEPKSKKVETLDYSNKNNYISKAKELEMRVCLFLGDNPTFLGIKFLYHAFLLNAKK